MKKISIIIPVFNTAKYLKKCLTSILNQTLKDIEIICINDGSTDNSEQILLEYVQKDSRIKVLSQEHKKQGSARNLGMQVATGEYIGFVDSDDWVDLDYYEKLYNTAKKYDSDIALAANIRIGNGKTKKRLHIEKEIFVTSLQGKIDIGKQAKNPCPTNKIYRRLMLEQNNIKWPEGMYCEDKLFTIQAIFYANGVVSVPDVNYYYFRNPTSTVNSRSKESIIHKNKANNEVLNFLISKNADIRDKDFWAVEKEFKLFGLPFYQVKKSLYTKKLLILGVKIAEYSMETACSKYNRIKILGIKIKYKNNNREENLNRFPQYDNKNILFVASYFVKIGGIETRLKQYISMLEEEGWHVYLLSENNENPYLKEKNNFYLNFNADNFNESLCKIIEKYKINVVEFQFKNSKILTKIDITLLKTKSYLGCTIHNIGVKNYNYINQLNYSIIVSNYLYQNEYSNINNSVVIQNSIEVNENQKCWQYASQDTALFISRISKDKLKSIECFIQYCRMHDIKFQIAGSEHNTDFLTQKLKKKYNLQEGVFIGAINTREYLEQNLHNILFVSGEGLVILESGILGIPSFCCSDWVGKNFSFVTKDNIALFDNFTIRKASPVSQNGKKCYAFELNDINKYFLKDYITQYRNFQILAKKYLNVLSKAL